MWAKPCIVWERMVCDKDPSASNQNQFLVINGGAKSHKQWVKISVSSETVFLPMTVSMPLFQFIIQVLTLQVFACEFFLGYLYLGFIKVLNCFFPLVYFLVAENDQYWERRGRLHWKKLGLQIIFIFECKRWHGGRGEIGISWDRTWHTIIDYCSWEKIVFLGSHCHRCWPPLHVILNQGDLTVDLYFKRSDLFCVEIKIWL